MLVITDIGLNKITKATINNPVILEKFAIGDGGGSEITPEASMTSLVNKRYRGEINSKSVRDNTIELGCIVPAFTEIDTDVTIRELGIFDIEGDLIAIMDITPEVFRPGGGNVLTELTFNVGIQLDNSEVVSISFNSQTFATIESVNQNTEEINQINNSLNEADYVIETQTGLSGNGFTNGWYRKYKSGWIEQGFITLNQSVNQAQINFPIAFADTNYVITFGHENSQTDYVFSLQYHNKTPKSAIFLGTYIGTSGTNGGINPAGKWCIVAQGRGA